MQAIVSLIRFLFNFGLFIIGAVAVVFIAAALNLVGVNQVDPRIVVDPGPLQGRAPSGSDARALQTALQARVDEINTPLFNNPTPVFFTIEAGESAQSVAEKLHTLGLVHDAQLFAQLLRYNKIDTRLQVGNYQLRRNMSMKQIAAALYRGYAGQITLTVPAGWRMEQLADYLTAANIMDGDRFLQQAQAGTAITHQLLADRPPGQSYEGYLFPGRYYLAEDAGPETLIAQMISNMANRLPANTLQLAGQQGLTFYQVLILASIVERETALAAERPLIASVYLNRLDPATEERHLQADPTVQYAMGYQPDTEQWWKTPVTLDEYQAVDSPYNTYLYPGLPPGPIASPSLESIVAVLQPAQTNYRYFVCRNPGCAGGEHVFAETYQEHLQNVTNYWGQQP